MEFTNHAIRRINQRGISRDSINVIWKYGRESFAPGGVYKLFFGKKECNKAISELKKMIKILENAKGRVLITDQCCVITGYKN